jgi:DNA-binding NarL/FixJ family response regulator
MTLPIRLLLVDDHAAFRLPLALVLEREPDLTVAVQTGSLAETRATLPTIAELVDVALIDLHLPGGNGVEIVSDLRAARWPGQTLVLTADTDKTHHAQAIEAGAAGILSKSVPPAAIVEAVRRVHAGELVQPAQEIIELLHLAREEGERSREVQALLAQLTAREREVLAGLAEGLDNKAIAERLYISPDTARAHVVKVLGKLGVDSRLQAAIFAIRHDIQEMHEGTSLGDEWNALHQRQGVLHRHEQAHPRHPQAVRLERAADNPRARRLRA